MPPAMDDDELSTSQNDKGSSEDDVIPMAELRRRRQIADVEMPSSDSDEDDDNAKTMTTAQTCHHRIVLCSKIIGLNVFKYIISYTSTLSVLSVLW